MITLDETIKYIIDTHLYYDEKADTQTAVNYTIQDAEVDLNTTQHVLSNLPTNHNYAIQIIDSMFTHMQDSSQLIKEAISNHINLTKLGEIL